MDKIKFAVIGTNFITERFIEAASFCEEFKLHGVYSRTMDRAEEFAKKYNIELVFDDLDELAESGDIDAVYIASPTSCHSRQACMMLRNGKHVLCEKPIASNSHELEAMMQLAEDKHMILLEAIRNVFTPGFQVIQDNLDKIGTVRRATFIYCQYSSRYDKFKQGIIENAFNPELSNGAIMDIGVYGIHMLAALFGRPFSLSAKGYILPSSVDGSGVVIGRYKEMQAEVIYSKISNSCMPSEIQGEDGNIVFLPLAAPEKIRIVLRNGKPKNLYSKIEKPDMYYEIRAFLDMVIGRRSDYKKYNDISITTMRLMDEARRQMDIVFPSDF